MMSAPCLNVRYKRLLHSTNLHLFSSSSFIEIRAEAESKESDTNPPIQKTSDTAMLREPRNKKSLFFESLIQSQQQKTLRKGFIESISGV